MEPALVLWLTLVIERNEAFLAESSYVSVVNLCVWNEVIFVLGLCGNWIEIAYGTSSGTVRVIVQHPETVGHGPQLFQTFTVHQSPVTKVSMFSFQTTWFSILSVIRLV